jgi:hypothetical protein
MDLIEHLSGDAGHQTLIFMSTGDLSMLCRACKASQLNATPFLYRRVELLFQIFRHDSMDQDQLDNFTDCYRRQRIFCETILARPDLASLVRELSWTIHFPVLPDEPLEPWMPPVPPDPDDNNPLVWFLHHNRMMAGPFQAPTDPFQSAKPDQVWQTFLLLENVRDLDLRVKDDTISEPDAQLATPSPFSKAPSTLFPNAHTVKLAGTCRLEFAKAVLSYNPARIRHLTINHLRLHGTGAIGWSVLVQSALPALTSLTFRKTGAYAPDEPFDTVEERAAFTELTTVLESARESLRYIYIGSTFAPHGCMVFGIMHGETPVSQGIFQELVVPT